MRFSPRFLNVFLRLAGPSFLSVFSTAAPSAAGSVLAIDDPVLQALDHDLLLRNRTLPRAFARSGVGARPLTADGQPTAVAHPAVAADLHQPLDVHRHFLAQITLDATLLLDHPA